MRVASVKPEYGPTLPTLIGLRLEGKSTVVRALLALATAVAFGALGAAIVLTRDPDSSYSGHGVKFAFTHPSQLAPVAPAAGEFLRLEDRHAGALVASMTVGPLHLGGLSGEISGAEPIYATRYIDALAARTPGFTLQSEGRIRLSAIPGYTFSYSRALDGLLYFGRVIFITPAPTQLGHGVTISLLTLPSAAPTPVGVISTPDVVGTYGLLTEPEHTFVVG